MNDRFYLECPGCQDCFTPQDLNESTAMYSIALKVMESEIPTNVHDYYDWLKKTGGGSIDCPSCGESFLLEDACIV